MEPIKNSPFGEVRLVGAVVRNIDRVVEYLGTLGIGPFGPAAQVPTYNEYKGRPVDNEVKAVVTNMGNADFVLMQPVSGHSIQHDFLESKGEGLFQLGFIVDDIDRAEKNLTSQGLNILQKGRSEHGGYAFFDTDRIGGAVFELIQRPKGVSIARTEQKPFNKLVQAASVVKDLDETIDFYEKLGIPSFNSLKMVIDQRWFKGETIEIRNDNKITQAGPLELELMQPVEGDSIQRQFFNQRGEGLHHLGFFMDNVEEEVTKLQSKGVELSQYGKSSYNSFNFFETDKIGGIILEFVRRQPQD